MAERERSPNYPAYGLATAIEFLRIVYTAVRRVAVSQEAISRALGSESLSGPARSKIAALNQYGLLEKVGAGEYRVSDRAMALILRNPGDREFMQAATEAALTPPLFASLINEKAGMDDSLLRFHLQTDRKFSDDGAKRVIKSFRETVAFANLSEGSYNDNDDREVAPEKPLAVQTQVRTGPARAMSAPASVTTFDPGERSYSLPNNLVAWLRLSDEPTKEALEELAFLIQRWASYTPSANERAVLDAFKGVPFEKPAALKE
jgi:hypothetical protein